LNKRKKKMMSRVRFLLMMVAIGVLLAACGGATSDTPEVEDAGGSSETRIKESAEIASAPRLFDANEIDGPAARGQAGITSDVAGVCLSAAEGDLARMINEYRASLNLPPLQISKSLSLVAQQHAWDTVNNSNAWPAPPAGKTCNMHSWSGVVNPALQQGTWTANCYTSDHANAQGMWNKPGQIAGFPGDGVENSFASSGTATAAGALTAWRNSPGHNNVITQQGGWGPMASMGVGMSGGVAHLWLSWVTDPAGEALLCSGGSAMVPPTAVPPTAVPPTAVPPTAVPPTEVPPTAVPPTAVPPTTAATAESTTAAATDVPPTDVPPTDVPPTAVPPTDVPPTDVPPTAVPPTTAPPAPTGEILNENGTIAAGGRNQHVFALAPGRTYTVVVTPSAEFDVDPRYTCTAGSGSIQGGFDWNWEGEAETLTLNSRGTGSCTIDVLGYQGSIGDYTIVVTAR
jgi:hypothetical protein